MRSGRLFRDGLATFALLAILGFLALKMNNRPELVKNGSFYAVDGDTLSVGGERLRLKGIDAPEYRQRCERSGIDWACGAESRKMLATMIKAGSPECRGKERDRHGRLLVTCVSGTLDINAAMVRNGMAVSYGGYANEERIARQAKAGLWAGNFERPSDYRREEHMAQSDPMSDFFGYIRRLVGWSGP